MVEDLLNEIVDRLILSGLSENEAMHLMARFLDETVPLYLQMQKQNNEAES